MQVEIKKRRNMPLKAFRIKEETINRLKEISANERISMSAVVNSILEEYTTYILPAKKDDSKLFFGKLSKKFIDEIDTKRLETIALEMGEQTFKASHDQGILSKNVSSFKKFICDIVCNFANWADYYEDSSRDKLFIKLYHHMGLKWSLFLKNFVYWEITQLENVDVKDVSFVYAENSLAISFPKVEPNR